MSDLEQAWTERRGELVELRVRIERGPVVETVRIVTDEALRPRGLYVAVQEPEGWRTLEALPRREGGWLAVLVSAPDGRRTRWDFPELAGEVLVDYPSPAVERFARERLALAGGALGGSAAARGEAHDVAVLRVTPPSLHVTAARRRYE